MQNTRLTQIQIIRAIAATAIFISHAFPKYGYLGGWGVSIFFVLSGFAMCYGYFNRELKIQSKTDTFVFACGRIKKMYLLHVLLLAFATIGIMLSSLNATGKIDIPMKALGLNVLLYMGSQKRHLLFFQR